MMNQPCLFSSGLELANLVVSSNLLDCSWNAISDLNKNTLFDNQRSVNYKVSKPDNVTVIAFVCSPEKSCVNYLQNEGRDMVSSDETEGSFELFDFVRDKANQSFSINKAADTIFSSIKDELSILKDQYGSVSPLIITGNSLGGSIASLFTLWLLDSVVQKDTKPPLCITFGSHFLGDNAFQRAISARPSWNSCFLHVVSDQDPVPKCLISSEPRVYKPFGTFLLCSDTGCACLEESESISEILIAMSSDSAGTQDQDPNTFSGIFDYGRLSESLKNNAIRKATGDSGINSRTKQKNVTVSPLEAEISLHLEAIGVKRLGQYQDKAAMNSLTTSIAKRVENLLMRRRNKFDPTKKLNDMKIHMTYLEWYKKRTVEQGGYYDCYKRTDSRTRDEIKSKAEIVKSKNFLTQYWERMVKEVNEMPQKEGAAFRTRWLYAGTNYRRMIEPLDIAEYYRKGNTDYMIHGSSKHYELLEQWINEDTSVKEAKKRNKACSLTEDSCFWAHVEEGIICCKVLKDGNSSAEREELSKAKLIEFENYVMNEIDKYAVSPEIFQPGSSFIKWWSEYISIMGASYESNLSDFMENYQEYA